MNQNSIEQNSNSVNTVPEKEKEPQIKITVSKDNMTVYLRVTADGCEDKVTPEYIKNFLKSCDIVYGINDDAIQYFCANKEFYKELIAANGKPPVNEKNGVIENNFTLNDEAKPQLREDGSVDYYDLGLMVEAKEGDVLCTLIPPSGGVCGTNVYGKSVDFKKGIIPRFPGGQNTVVSDDKMHLLAAKTGFINYKNSVVSVGEVYVIKGSVDNHTGNIQFSGSVVVNGDVCGGFKIISGGDVSVKGTVEGAYIEAAGDINLSSGMIGMSTGELKAGGNVNGKYFESSRIVCDGNVKADIFMNCNVEAKGNIIVRDKILGGAYKSEASIFSSNVGNDNELDSTLEIESPVVNVALLTNKNDVKGYKEELSALKKDYEELEQKRNEAGADRAALRNYLREKSNLESEMSVLESKIADADQRANSINNFKIVVKGSVFGGTKIKIGPFTMNIADKHDHIKFLAQPDGIMKGQILPSDIA